MKKLYFIFFLLIAVSCVQAQYYVWTQTDTVTTAAVDSTWTVRWEQCTFYFYGCDGYIKIGAPDTTSWSSRTWTRVPEYVTISVDYRTPFKKLSYKSVSGAGRIYWVGIKRSTQF